MGVTEEDLADFLEAGAEVVERSSGAMLTSVLVVSRSASDFDCGSTDNVHS